MSERILVDTDVWIDFLRGHAEATTFVTANAERILMSSIGVAELYAGVRGDAGSPERRALEDLIRLFRVVPATTEIGRIGGLYKREYGPSHGVSLADAIVAATATAEAAKLATLNVKHYPMLKGVEPPYRK